MNRKALHLLYFMALDFFLLFSSIRKQTRTSVHAETLIFDSGYYNG
jgi:hypothetical protein